MNLSVQLCNMTLDNPLIAASGVFGYGYDYTDQLKSMGCCSVKGTTVTPRFGNETPRIAECDSGLLNSVGLQNPGIDSVIAQELPRLSQVYDRPVLANMSGFAVEEFVTLAERFNDAPNVGILEVNISCPNVHGGGLAFGNNPEAAAQVTKAVKAVSKKPVFVKLSPNTADIVSVAKACEAAGADGLSLINTLLGMRLDARTGKPILANVKGGLSGPCVFPVALRMVYEVAGAVDIPVIGIGGVDSALKVIEMMSAGARAVQIGSAFLRDPGVFARIAQELPTRLADIGVKDINDIVGRAHA